MQYSDADYVAYMKHALSLAQKARWKTAPNPCVGALIVHKGSIVAEGWHQGAGMPHAEIEAITAARAKGVPLAESMLVVTLEPCNHNGKMPPCTATILEASIPHVVIGVRDPNPKAAGGIDLLRSHGVKVTVGVAQAECLDAIDDFITWQTTDFPYVILKLASTLDGRIATRTGHSKWITAEETRGNVHELRRHMDAIIIGGNTFYQDDPKLTARDLSGNPYEKSPLRIVTTSRLPDASATYHLLAENPKNTVFWTTVAAAASPKAELLRKLGIRIIGLPSGPRDANHGFNVRSTLDFSDALQALRTEHGCHYVLCEGGGKLGLSLLQKKLVRELHLHLAPKILGDNEATPLFDGQSPDVMSEALGLRFTDVRYCECDLMLTLKAANNTNCVCEEQ